MDGYVNGGRNTSGMFADDDGSDAVFLVNVEDLFHNATSSTGDSVMLTTAASNVSAPQTYQFYRVCRSISTRFGAP